MVDTNMIEPPYGDHLSQVSRFMREKTDDLPG